MKFSASPAFQTDAARLPGEHYKLFRQAVFSYLLPASEAGAHKGEAPWPRRLRIHQVGGGIYSMTWSFAGPDGRATFTFDTDDAGQTVLVWRRIGGRAIYRRP